MAVEAPKRTAGSTTPPRLRLVEGRQRPTNLHLFTYLVGNALFWTLWGGVAVSADPAYWWPVVPLAGWTLVLTLHLRRVSRS